VPQRDALITALILDRPLCMDYLTTTAEATHADVEPSLTTIETCYRSIAHGIVAARVRG